MSGIAQALFARAAAASGITFVNAGAVATAAATLNPAMPASFAAGDLLVVIGASNAATPWSTPPAGYTAANAITTIGVWYKIAAGGETAPTLISGGANSSQQAAVVLAYRGTNATPLDVQNASIATGTSTSPTPASLTTTTANALIITIWATAAGTAITANGSTNSRASTTTGRSFTVGDEIQVAAGASTARAGTMSSAAWQSFAIAFKP
jgi:hypothetical protein